MLKTWPLCTSAELKLRDRIWGEVEKNCFNALPGKGDIGDSCPQLCVPSPGEFGGGVYTSGSRAEVLVCVSVCVQGRQSPNELI